MSGSLLTINPSHRTHQITPAAASDLYDQMEATQAKVDSRNMELDLSESPLKNVPIHLQREALEVVDELCNKTGQESMTRRLARLMGRVAEAAERHIFQKQETQYEKKTSIKLNVSDQKEWKSYQAWTQSGGGFGSAFLSISGSLIPGPVGEVLKGLSQFSQPAAMSLSTWIDSQLGPLHHEEQFYINTTQSERQTIETLKNLPKELQQLIQRLLDLESQANRSVFQR